MTAQDDAFMNEPEHQVHEAADSMVKAMGQLLKFHADPATRRLVAMELASIGTVGSCCIAMLDEMRQEREREKIGQLFPQQPQHLIAAE